MTFTPCRSRRRVRAAAAMSCLVPWGAPVAVTTATTRRRRHRRSRPRPRPRPEESTGALTGTVNLGFLNVTHVLALVGMEQGLFADALR